MRGEIGMCIPSKACGKSVKRARKASDKLLMDSGGYESGNWHVYTLGGVRKRLQTSYWRTREGMRGKIDMCILSRRVGKASSSMSKRLQVSF